MTIWCAMTKGEVDAWVLVLFFFFQAEDGIRDLTVTGVQTCALPIWRCDQIFLTSTGDKSGGISVLCLSAEDGKLIWRRGFPLTPFARHQFNSFASSDRKSVV